MAHRSAGLPRINRPDAVTAFTRLGCWQLERAADCKNALGTCQGQRGPYAPIPSPKFPVREAPLASVARGFLLPPIRNKALNGAAAGCRKHPTATCHNAPDNRRVVTDYDISKTCSLSWSSS